MGKPAVLLRFVQLKEETATKTLEATCELYTNAKYPGLLHPRRDPTEIDQATGREIHRETRYLVSMLQESQGGLGTPLPEDEMERARRAIESGDAISVDVVHMGPAPRLPMLPISLTPIVDPNLVVPTDEELLDRAKRSRVDAGVWNAVPDEIMAQEVVVQLRCINTAARNHILKQYKDPWVRAEKLQDYMRKATRESLDVLFKTQTTSPTIKAVRDSIERLYDDGGPIYMNIQPSVNPTEDEDGKAENTWHMALTWLLNTTIGPLNISIRTMHVFLVLYIMRFEHMWLQEWGGGKV